MCDKLELYQACVNLLELMEEELPREEQSLSFCDAWEVFEEYVEELRAELDDE